MEVEIPFIPAPQRSINVLNEEQDTIVVVGQARQKRKRPKASPEGVEAAGAAGERIKKPKVKNGGEARDGGEAFDFSAVPNILDDNPNMDDGKKKKKREKREKKGERFYSLFSIRLMTLFFIPNLHRRFS
jgi:exosome complex exonuclease RRP6